MLSADNVRMPPSFPQPYQDNNLKYEMKKMIKNGDICKLYINSLLTLVSGCNKKIQKLQR